MGETQVLVCALATLDRWIALGEQLTIGVLNVTKARRVRELWRNAQLPHSNTQESDYLPREGGLRKLVAVVAVGSDRADRPAHDHLRGLARPSAPTGVAQ